MARAADNPVVEVFVEMSEALAALLEVHVIGGWEHQLYLDERTEGAWELDLTIPQVSYAELQTEAQLLGTWSESSETWLWAWANPSGLPDACMQAARRLRALGEERGIPELVEAKLDHVEPFELAMVARGLLGGAGYRRCPYEGGAAFVLLPDTALFVASEIALARLVTVLGQVLQEADMPRPAVSIAAWAEQHGLSSTREGSELRVRSPEGDEGVFHLDEDGCVINIEASLAGRG